MAIYTKQLIPSSNTHSSQLGIEDKDNMYSSVSSDTYGYVFYKDDEYGFPQFQTFYVDLEIGEIIPEGATITSLSVRFKGRQANVQSYCSLLADGSYIGRTNALQSSLSVLPISVSQPQRLVSKNLKFRIEYTLQNKNANGDLFIYGAEINVTYKYNDVYVKVGASWKKSKQIYQKNNGEWVKVPNTIISEDEHYEKGE